MKDYVYSERTERNLPHWQPTDATFFVTFRLADSIPQPVLRFYLAQKQWLDEEGNRIRNLKLQEGSPEVLLHEERLVEFHRQWFLRFEEILHKAEIGPTWLKNPAIAEIVKEALHHRDGKIFRLDAYCIMSNHVHLVFAPLLSYREMREVQSSRGLRFISENPPLNNIMQSLKGWTAWKANQVLGRKGSFWRGESYDHVIRNSGEYERIVRYVLQNPVKAGIVNDWREWKWSYSRDFVEPSVQRTIQAAAT